MAERLYTVTEVADFLKTDKNRVYALIRAGLIKCMRIGHLKIRESELNSFIESYDGKDVNDPSNIKDVDYSIITADEAS